MARRSPIQLLVLLLAGPPALAAQARPALPDSVRAQIRRLDSSAVAARAKADLSDESAALRQIGELYAGRGRIDSAVARYRQALAVVRRRTDQYWLEHAEREIMLRIGELHQAAGRVDLAIAQYRLAFQPMDSLLREISTRWPELKERVQTDQGTRLAVAMFLEEAGLALQHLGAAFRASRLEDSARTAFALAYQQFRWRRQLDSTIGAVPDPTCVPATPDLFESERRLRLHSLQDDPLPILLADLRAHRAVGAFLLECRILVAIGDYYRDRARTDSARVYFARAETIVREVGDSLGLAVTAARLSSLESGPKGMDREGASGHIALLTRLGDSLHALGTDGSLRQAVARYDTAAAEVASLMVHTADEPLRVRHAESLTGLTERSVLAWLARAPWIGTDTSAYAALAAADRFRAWSLRLARGETMFFDGVPYGEALAAGARATVGLALGGGFGIRGLYYQMARDTLLIWLLSPDSETVQLTRVPVSAERLSGLIASARTAIAGGGGREPLQRIVDDRTRGVLASGGGGPPDSLLARLAEMVLPQELRAALPDSGELVIFPQGILAGIPFAALPLGAGGERIGARHSIRYGPSLRLLQDAELDGQAERMPLVPDTVIMFRELMSKQSILEEHRRFTARQDSLRAWLARGLVAGDPLMPTWGAPERRGTLPALPGARIEANAVATQLGVRALAGPTASEAAIRTRLSGSTIVHLASHGLAFAADERVNDSFVALAPGTGQDGLLTVGEILGDDRIRLIADLVVLSACQSGLGAPMRAEGILGLQRAFLAKGARSVLVSLWNVSDEATAVLMRRFYFHWIAGRGSVAKAEALRLAQEDVRKTPGFEQPRFWGAFQLVGAR